MAFVTQPLVSNMGGQTLNRRAVQLDRRQRALVATVIYPFVVSYSWPRSFVVTNSIGHVLLEAAPSTPPPRFASSHKVLAAPRVNTCSAQVLHCFTLS